MGNDLFFSKLLKITRDYVFVVLKSYRNQDRNYDLYYIADSKITRHEMGGMVKYKPTLKLYIIRTSHIEVGGHYPFCNPVVS